MNSWMTELLRLSATASLAALVVVFVRLLLVRAPRIYSYILWLVVFSRAILPVSFTTAFSFLGLFSRISRTGGVIRMRPLHVNKILPVPAGTSV